MLKVWGGERSWCEEEEEEEGGLMFQSTFVLAKKDILARWPYLGKTELYPLIFPLFSQTYLHKNHTHFIFSVVDKTNPSLISLRINSDVIVLVHPSIVFKNKRLRLLYTSIVMTNKRLYPPLVSARIARDVIEDSLFLRKKGRNSAPTILLKRLKVFVWLYECRRNMFYSG